MVVWREQGTKLQESLPSEITQDMLNSHSNTLWQLMPNGCPPGKLFRDSAPKVKIGHRSYRHLTTCQTSRKKAGVQHEHIVYTKTLATVSHSFQFRESWWPSQNLSSQMPIQSALQAGFSNESSLETAALGLFYTNPPTLCYCYHIFYLSIF